MIKTVLQTLFLGFLLFHNIHAQKFTVSGYVRDAETGEELIGASVILTDQNVGTVTNEYGFYSVTLPEGSYKLAVSYISYQTFNTTIRLSESKTIHIELSPSAVELEEAVVTAQASDNNVSSTEMGVVSLNAKEIKRIPMLFGEEDLVKVIQLMPGVKSAGEGNTGFYVRGGGVDQNLILLDEATVFNPSHLGGFFSVFNSDAVKDVTLYKGGIPAQYGGRGSSVLDIKMKEGNMKEDYIAGGIGTIFSKLTYETPIIEDKWSVLASGRRSYADIFLFVSSDSAVKNSKLYFYDLNLKSNYIISDKDRIFVSGYFGRDVINYNGIFGIDWGNKTLTVRWNHIFGDRLFLNSSVIYSDYDYAITSGFDADPIKIGSGIVNYSLKEDFQYYISPAFSIRFGGQLSYYKFSPGKLLSDGDQFNSIVLPKKYSLEEALYVSVEQDIRSNIRAEYGLRFSGLTILGRQRVLQSTGFAEVYDTITFDKNEVIKQYSGLEPRISINFKVNNSNSIKAGYNRNYQYIHLLSSSIASSPTDYWIPSSELVEPQIVDQIAIGYFRNLRENVYESSVEVYYKDLKNQIDYKSGAQILLDEAYEHDLVAGKGEAYGLEFMVRKQQGKLTGWIGYTISRTLRKYDEINDGDWFPARQDRIHDINIVAMYQITQKFNVSAAWVYYTGDAVTFPSGQYTIDGNTVPYYTERNGYRMPDYHRLDLGMTYNFRAQRNKESNLNISLYNAYGRKNAYLIYFRKNENNPNQMEAVKVSLFRFIPSISYTFKF